MPRMPLKKKTIECGKGCRRGERETKSCGVQTDVSYPNTWNNVLVDLDPQIIYCLNNAYNAGAAASAGRGFLDKIINVPSESSLATIGAASVKQPFNWDDFLGAPSTTSGQTFNAMNAPLVELPSYVRSPTQMMDCQKDRKSSSKAKAGTQEDDEVAAPRLPPRSSSLPRTASSSSSGNMRKSVEGFDKIILSVLEMMSSFSGEQRQKAFKAMARLFNHSAEDIQFATKCVQYFGEILALLKDSENPNPSPALVPDAPPPARRSRSKKREAKPATPKKPTGSERSSSAKAPKEPQTAAVSATSVRSASANKSPTPRVSRKKASTAAVSATATKTSKTAADIPYPVALVDVSRFSCGPYKGPNVNSMLGKCKTVRFNDYVEKIFFDYYPVEREAIDSQVKIIDASPSAPNPKGPIKCNKKCHRNF